MGSKQEKVVSSICRSTQELRCQLRLKAKAKTKKTKGKRMKISISMMKMANLGQKELKERMENHVQKDKMVKTVSPDPKAKKAKKVSQGRREKTHLLLVKVWMVKMKKAPPSKKARKEKQMKTPIKKGNHQQRPILNWMKMVEATRPIELQARPSLNSMLEFVIMVAL